MARACDWPVAVSWPTRCGVTVGLAKVGDRHYCKEHARRVKELRDWLGSKNALETIWRKKAC